MALQKCHLDQDLGQDFPDIVPILMVDGFLNLGLGFLLSYLTLRLCRWCLVFSLIQVPLLNESEDVLKNITGLVLTPDKLGQNEEHGTSNMTFNPIPDFNYGHFCLINFLIPAGMLVHYVLNHSNCPSSIE